MENQQVKDSSVLKYIIIIGLAAIILAFFALRGDKVDRIDVPVGANDAIIGDVNANVTVIEFTDFSCPFCAAANGYNQESINYLKSRNPSWEAPVPKIYDEYVKTGKARIVVKYAFGHTGGKPAQNVAWCLYEQSPDKYWNFYHEAFANQNDVENIEKMKTLAQQNGANSGQLQICLDSKKYESRFNEQTLQGMNAGVQGTPTFFVNGMKLEGAVSYSDFQKVIENELK